MLTPQAATPLERQASFERFYADLAPVLIDFIDALGIEPAPEVLRQAGQYLPYVERALKDMEIADDDDRSWLLARMMYFIGEYFAQQYGGHWYVNETVGSPLFGRCVVGQFGRIADRGFVLDPYALALDYVNAPCPRPLSILVARAESGISGPALH